MNSRWCATVEWLGLVALLLGLALICRRARPAPVKSVVQVVVPVDSISLLTLSKGQLVYVPFRVRCWIPDGKCAILEAVKP